MSKYIREQKDKSSKYPVVEQKIIKMAQAQKTTSKSCKLCLQIKFQFIIFLEQKCLNKIFELVCKCRHDFIERLKKKKINK